MLRLIIPELTIKQVEKLWARVDTTPGQGPFGTCWEWKAFRHDSGYGYVRYGKHMYRPHRIVYKLYYLEEPGDDAMHRCDHPPCCHPCHLASGTRLDNIQDMVIKGRGYDKSGEGNPRATLLISQVMDIRRRIDEGEKQIDLALEYHQTPGGINSIHKRRTWKHI